MHAIAATPGCPGGRDTTGALPRSRSPRGRHVLLGWLLSILLAACHTPPNVALPHAPLVGRVLGPDGKPASGVEVTAYFTNATPFGSTAPLQGQDVAEAPPAESVAVRTGPDGRFAFDAPPAGPLNLEAVESDDLKAIRMGVDVSHGASVDVGDIDLAPTGTLTGKVTAPDAPQVTDFLGTDVYVPGTDYLAKSDGTGNFTLDHVAVGTMEVVADNPDLGRAVDPAVTVVSSKTTSVPDLALSLSVPTVTGLLPGNGGPDTVIEIDGTNFGQSSGKPIMVNFGGLVATQVTRLSDFRLDATIPAGANTGPVVVTVGSVPSAATAILTVLHALSISPSGPTLVPPGGTLALSATGIDTGGAPVSEPTVSWKSGDLSTGSIDSQGHFHGRGLGEVGVTASSGTVTRTAYVEVSPASGSPISLGSGTSGARRLVGAGGACMGLWEASGRTVGALFGPGGQPGAAISLPSSLGALSADAELPALTASATGFEAILPMTDASGSIDLVAQPIGTGGILGTPSLLATGLSGATMLAAAAGTNATMVTWQEPDAHLWGLLAGASPSSPVALTSETGGQGEQALAWDGSRFVLVWQDGRNGNNDIYAMTIGPDGALSPQFPICSDPGDQEAPRIACGGGVSLVIWSDRRSGQPAIWGQRLAGGSLTGSQFLIDASGTDGHPVVCWTGKAFLVAWEDVIHGTPALSGRLVAPDGTLSGPSFVVALGNGTPSLPEVAPLGNAAFLAWSAGQGDLWAVPVILP